MTAQPKVRIGVDFGGTKIEAAILDRDGRFLSRVRAPNPGDYEAAMQTVAELVTRAEQQAGVVTDRVGIGHPGSISPVTSLIRNANSVWLNGQPFGADLEKALGRAVRLSNDANCLAASEGTDGAAAGTDTAFCAILGTGCGGGVISGGRMIDGQNGIAGEWGHTPLPWPTAEEYPGPQCWCGRRSCLEMWISGTGLERDYRQQRGGSAMTAQAIVDAAHTGAAQEAKALDLYIDRLARALACVCDLIDPQVIVLGGGMSNTKALYERLPDLVGHYAFTDRFTTPIRPAKHGDSSGVRGAAWLWPVHG